MSAARSQLQVVDHLERLVREVDGVPAIQEDVVGDGGEHDVGDRRGIHRGEADASVRSAASEDRVSMNLRYHPSKSICGQLTTERQQRENVVPGLECPGTRTSCRGPTPGRGQPDPGAAGRWPST